MQAEEPSGFSAPQATQKIELGRLLWRATAALADTGRGALAGEAGRGTGLAGFGIGGVAGGAGLAAFGGMAGTGTACAGDRWGWGRWG